MTRARQKKMEMFYATCLAEKASENWLIKPSVSEEDWPDLLVECDQGQFGLEVRDVFKDEKVGKGSRLKRNENENSKLLKKLADYYYRISEIPLSVRLVGNFRESDIEYIANMMKEEINLAEDMQTIRYECRPLNTFYITRLPKKFESYNIWRNVSDSTSWVSQLSMGIINDAIAAKAEKLVKYRKNICDVRLLLVLDGLKSSGMIRIPNVEGLSGLGFEKVYLFAYPDEFRVIEHAS